MSEVLYAGVRGFTDVDAYDAEKYIAYLDACAGSSSVRPPLYAVQGISPGMSVVDVGCGTGDHVRAISELVTGSGSVAGVDSSRAMIAEARRRGVPANTWFGAASAYELPFGDATFHVARAERVFQHLERPNEAAAELHRVLKPGGSVLLLDQDWDTIAVAGADRTLTRRIVTAFTNSLANGNAGRGHTATLTRAGFRDVRVAAGVTSLPFSQAYAFVLESALEAAKSKGAVSTSEADVWLTSLIDADRDGTFSYGVTVFVTVAAR